jgi:hypothetical protein
LSGLLRLWPGKGAHIRFCETNPPFLRQKLCTSSILQDTYVVCRGFLQVGSFWKTNPPEGCFRGVFPEERPRFPGNDATEGSCDGDMPPTFNPRKEFGAESRSPRGYADEGTEGPNYLDFPSMLCSTPTVGFTKHYYYEYFGRPSIWLHAHRSCITHGRGPRTRSNHEQLDRSLQWQMGESTTLG